MDWGLSEWPPIIHQTRLLLIPSGLVHNRVVCWLPSGTFLKHLDKVCGWHHCGGTHPKGGWIRPHGQTLKKSSQTLRKEEQSLNQEGVLGKGVVRQIFGCADLRWSILDYQYQDSPAVITFLRVLRRNDQKEKLLVMCYAVQSPFNSFFNFWLFFWYVVLLVYYCGPHGGCLTAGRPLIKSQQGLFYVEFACFFLCRVFSNHSRYSPKTCLLGWLMTRPWIVPRCDCECVIVWPCDKLATCPGCTGFHPTGGSGSSVTPKGI